MSKQTQNKSEKTEISKFNLNPDYLLTINKSPIIVKLHLDALYEYDNFCKSIPENIKRNYENINPKYLKKLNFNYKDKIEKVKQGISLNSKFLKNVADLYKDNFSKIEIPPEQIEPFLQQNGNYLRGGIFLYLIREWTEEGKKERDISYGQIIEELKKYCPTNKNILLTKDSFGRLAYELLKIGYNVTFCNYYYYHLFITDYLYNCSKKNGDVICPRIHSFCSSYTSESVTKKLNIPDVEIDKNLSKNLTVIQNEFVYNYKGQKDLFDGVVTFFATEDVKNMIEFVEVVHDVLKTGGIWINFGSLANNMEPYGGFALTWEEWKKVIENYGFEFKREETQNVLYCYSEGYAMPNTIGVIFFSVIKK